MPSDEIHIAQMLIDAALEYACDPLGWRRTLCEGLCEATRSVVVLSAEITGHRDADRAQVRLFVDSGWPDGAQQQAFARYQTEGGNAEDPFRAVLATQKADVVVQGLSRALDYAAYLESDFYDAWMKPAGVGDMLCSITAIGQVDAGLSSLFTCIRDVRDPTFGDFEVKLMQAVAARLRQMVGDRLQDATSPVLGLTHRRRAALELLLAGFPEREAARQMGVSQNTYHTHVAGLYRDFDVKSRAELQAKFYGRGTLRPDAMQGFDHRHNRIRRQAAPMAASWKKDRPPG